ncbi:MAG: NADH-quinone oxidoreductase subunit J [Cytophagaceae bacterium]|nr:NADH-quinone oxidoreductase subunit J [Cytophagaceae bacterium]MDW8455974.1 NADH-quinone oxidoreductase subunit J [Cytophagaceae bacterium]
MEQIIFIILSLAAIISALVVIFSNNPVYSVLSLVITFFSIAGHFVLLNAQFLAIVNVIVYAGAIMVLFLFVIMLLNLNKSSEPSAPLIMKVASSVAGGLLFITLLGALRQSEASAGLSGGNIGSVESLGRTLFTNFLFPFEVSSVLFLSAMIGAVMLGKKNLKDS